MPAPGPAGPTPSSCASAVGRVNDSGASVRPGSVRIIADRQTPPTRGVSTSSTSEGVVQKVRAAYEAAFAEEPFVHLLPEGVWPQTQAVVGSNAVQVQVTVDEAAGRLVVVAALDNLAKGTAGGAVQSMNLALGLPETTGLSTIGVAP